MARVQIFLTGFVQLASFLSEYNKNILNLSAARQQLSMRYFTCLTAVLL
jgi:hypothetical protein